MRQHVCGDHEDLGLSDCYNNMAKLSVPIACNMARLSVLVALCAVQDGSALHAHKASKVVAAPKAAAKSAGAAALAAAISLAPMAAVAGPLSVEVGDLVGDLSGGSPTIELPFLGRFAVAVTPAKKEGKATVTLGGDLVGAALNALGGKAAVTFTTPPVGPLPGLDRETLDIGITSQPGVLGVTIVNPSLPKLPIGGGTSDWSAVTNVGSGATYYFNSKTGVTQFESPIKPTAKPPKAAAPPKTAEPAPEKAAAPAAKKAEPAPKKAAAPRPAATVKPPPAPYHASHVTRNQGRRRT